MRGINRASWLVEWLGGPNDGAVMEVPEGTRTVTMPDGRSYEVKGDTILYREGPPRPHLSGV